MKVKILVQNGQTGLRKPGTVVEIDKAIAKHWIAHKWAESLVKPKKKTKAKKAE